MPSTCKPAYARHAILCESVSNRMPRGVGLRTAQLGAVDQHDCIHAAVASGNDLTALHHIAESHGTDKSIHGSALLYPYLLSALRFAGPFNLLEIGVFREESLRMWRDWLPCARVFGAGKNHAKPSGNFTVWTVDQHVDAQVRQLADRMTWTVVVDDGSHKPTDQLRSFMRFFPLLKPGGVYIIEDIETSYWARGYGRGFLYDWTMEDESEETDVVLRFQRAQELVLNKRYMCREPTPVFSPTVDSMIGAIFLMRNVIGVVKTPEELTSPPWEHYKKLHGKQNCRERRWQPAKFQFRSVEAVLNDTRAERRARAFAEKEPAGPRDLRGGVVDVVQNS